MSNSGFKLPPSAKYLLIGTGDHQKEIKDVKQLDAFFRSKSKKSPGPVLYCYNENIDGGVLLRLFDELKDTIKHFKCEPPGLRDITDNSIVDGAVHFQEYKCDCSPAGNQGRGCDRDVVDFTITALYQDVEDRSPGLTTRSGSNNIPNLAAILGAFAVDEGPHFDFSNRQPTISQQRNGDIELVNGTYGKISFKLRSQHVIFFYENGCWQTFAPRPWGPMKVYSSPKAYIEAELNIICEQWQSLLDYCRLCLSMDVSLTNRNVLNLEDNDEIDRGLLRNLIKTALIWEFLVGLHRNQMYTFKELVNVIEGNPKRSQGVVSATTASNALDTLRRIGDDIQRVLVDESTKVIERTHNLVSIDEAYRSRDQNASMKRLSWITFIFLPLLFVASLYSMNVDLLEKTPSWTTYFYIAIPLFICVVLSVFLLKAAKKLRKRMSSVSSFFPSGLLTRAMKRFHFWKYTALRGKETHEFDGMLVLYERANWTPLQIASRGGQFPIVKRILESGQADVNAKPATDKGRTALQAAAEGGHLDVVNLLLQNMAHVNAEAGEQSGRTALQAAAAGGHLAVVQLLLEYQADANAKPAKYEGRTALQAAAEGGHFDVVKLMLETRPARADVNAEPATSEGLTALQAAAEGGHFDVVKFLLSYGANVNPEAGQDKGRTPLQAAAAGGHLEVVELLLQRRADVNAKPAKYEGRTALQAAAEGGHLDVVKLLLKKGAHANAGPAAMRGVTALQAAAAGGHLKVVKLLLKHDADINAKPEPMRRTPLQAAAAAGHRDVVMLMLERGAVVDEEWAKGYGNKLLRAAARDGRPEAVGVFIRSGADPNARSDEGIILEIAAGVGHLEVVRLLVEAGANLDARQEPIGRTALLAAAAGGHSEVVQLLLERGADPRAGACQRAVTALMEAAKGGYGEMAASSDSGSLEIIKCLLNNPAHVNDQDPLICGQAALLAAAERGHIELVKLLLEKQAHMKARAELTALDAAVLNNHQECAELLKTHISKCSNEPR